MKQPSFHDVELLSAYLDGQLSRVDSARLESRIKTDPGLRSVYDDLRQSRALLRKLPARRAPRNFTLTPRMAGIKPPLPRTFPIFRLASTLAAILFFFGYAVNLSVPAIAAMRAAAPAPAFGMGGGGGAPEEPALEMAPAPTDAPPGETASDATAQQDSANAAIPTATAEAPRVMAEPTDLAYAPEGEQKIDPYHRDVSPTTYQPVTLPVPPVWLFGLLALAVVSGGTAWLVRARVEQDWRKANAVRPRKIRTKDILIFALALLAILLLGAGIYWMSTATFYAPVALTFPSGPLGGEKGNAPVSAAQDISLTPGTGYNFSTLDDQNLITAIDFPADAVSGETTIRFIPGLENTPPAVTFFANRAFTLLPSPKDTRLQTPITITLDYGEDTASMVDETKLALQWWSGDEWRDAAATCSPESIYERLPESNRIRVSVCMLGSFVLVAP
jgi:hypothetical protein